MKDVQMSSVIRIMTVLGMTTANRKRIEHEARRKYLADRIETDGSVLIRTSDL